MRKTCALYREEKKKEKGFEWTHEYCDGLEVRLCNLQDCPFYKSKEEWRAVVVRKQTQYVRAE